MWKREEIQRLKATNPDISHREAFSAAAKNALFVWAFRSSVFGKCRRKAGKQMNLRRRLLRFHPPALRNAPKSSVWSSHLPPPFRTLRFHPPDRSATAETNEALVSSQTHMHNTKMSSE
ncbi:Axial regulator YABBY 1 [Platanthera guangdongensis]|uniref:Axial regulator YABBY 1 n=1 Tax=Platanthera guangdongensis TaxID=2320717 RepID=A0ABR2N2I0_9ASPA